MNTLIDAIINIDVNILMHIQKYFHTSFLDGVMPIITSLGNSGIIWIVISIILMLNKKYRKIGFIMAAALILAAFMGEVVLKNLVKRPRPCTAMPFVDMLINRPTSYSFPSGHTASSFTAATVLLINWRRAGICALVLASIIAFSRLYLFVHYPSDVLAGAILGVSCGLVVNYLYKKTSKDMKSKIT